MKQDWLIDRLTELSVAITIAGSRYRKQLRRRKGSIETAARRSKKIFDKLSDEVEEIILKLEHQ